MQSRDKDCNFEYIYARVQLNDKTKQETSREKLRTDIQMSEKFTDSIPTQLQDLR